MDTQLREVHEAAQLLGKRGGTKTLEKYGRDQLIRWGKRGAEFGKLGGRPKKTVNSAGTAGITGGPHR